MAIRFRSAALLCMWLIPAAAPAADEVQPEQRRLLPGVRVACFGAQPFRNSTVKAETTRPDASYTYSATAGSPGCYLGPAVEYRLSNRLSLGIELHFYHSKYSQTLTILNGTPPTTGQTDNRTTSTINQTSKLNNWELPLLARYVVPYFGSGTKHPYVSGGLIYRYIGRIRTGNSYGYPDGTNDYNETPPAPNLRNQLGVTAGIGVPLWRRGTFKATPEVRYVRWFGVAMRGTAFHSAMNQVEGGIGFSF
jgi:hypothetical protein